MYELYGNGVVDTVKVATWIYDIGYHVGNTFADFINYIKDMSNIKHAVVIPPSFI